MSDGSKQTFSPVFRSNRPALLISFFVSFLWLAFVFNGVIDRIEFLQVKVLVGFFVPTFATVAILYRSSLFRDDRRWVRVIRLFLYGVALLICAFMLLSAIAVFLFAVGAISPN